VITITHNNRHIVQNISGRRSDMKLSHYYGIIKELVNLSCNKSGWKCEKTMESGSLLFIGWTLRCVSCIAIRLLQLVTNARPHWQTRSIRLVTACAGSFLRKSAAVYLLFMWLSWSGMTCFFCLHLYREEQLRHNEEKCSRSNLIPFTLCLIVLEVIKRACKMCDVRNAYVTLVG